MKFNRLQKILSCLLMSVLALQASYFFLAVPAKATNTQTWTEITPRQIGDPGYSGWFGTSPSMGPNDLRYANNPSYYTSQWTTIADLVETKPNGSKVFHFFVGMPNSNQYSWSNFAPGRIYHYSSADQYRTWTLINPSNWGSVGGGSHMTLKAVNKTWTDSNGSIWNKKLFLFCNSSTYIDANFYGQNAYQIMKATFYRYDGNGSATGWVQMVNPADSTWRYSYGNYYSAGQIKGHYGAKMYFDYFDCTNNGIDDGTIYLISPYAYSTIYNYGQVSTRLRVVRYNGTQNDLWTSATPSPSWTYTEFTGNYVLNYYQLNYFFDVEKVVTTTNQYLFISTVALSGNGSEPYTGNGLLYRYDACSHAIQYPSSSAAPRGQVTSALSTSGSYWTFSLRMSYPGGSVIKTAYLRRSGYWADPSEVYINWGSHNDITWGPQYYWSNYIYPSMWWNPNPKSVIAYTIASETATTVYLDAMEALPYYGYSWDPNYRTAILDGSKAPLSLEFFKGDLYGGSIGGVLKRTNSFTTPAAVDFPNWTTVSPITANNNLNQVRTMNSYITSLGKMIKKNAFGVEEDVTLYIGGFQGPNYYNTGEGILFATNGGPTLTYFIVEDEWRYTKDDTSGPRMYKGTLYMIYDIYPSSLGLIVSFSSSRRRYSTADGGGFGDRYFHLYNASPTCEILVNPDPVINERGSDSDVCFTFTPIGGFGSGNVQIFIQGIPINVYLPKKDTNGTPVNLQVSDSPVVIKAVNMNGGILTICAVIRSTRSAQVGTYSLSVTIRDLVLGIDVSKNFTLLVVYPKPGFSERLTPSMIELYQGDCDTGTDVANRNVILQQYCSITETISCQQIDVDIESRNDFEENVVMGMYWLTEPPSQDITAEWQQNPFIYDFIDTKTVEVITRKNITTRYSFIVKVTPNTTVGIWKLKLFFLSGTIKHFKTLTITVLRAKPCIEITSIPKIVRVVPGANAQYRIQVKSIDYNGKVALSLANVPPDVEVLNFYAENPPPGYADNYVELSSGGVAYAVLELRTYAVTVDPYPPANVIVSNLTDTKNVISWDGSKQGTNPVAGYEIWRGLSQYTDKALKLGTVPSTTTNFDDDNFDRTKTYYYFVRSFDNQTPPNYSEWAQSDPFKLTATEEEKASLLASVIPHDGSAPGRFEIYVIGQGAGFNDITHQQAEVCAVGIANLQIFEQMEDMATPVLNTWGWFIILIAMVAAFYVVSKRVDNKKAIK